MKSAKVLQPAQIDLSANAARQVIDLDASANAAPTECVVAAVVAAMSAGHANPSSGHAGGGRGRGIVERARDAVAALLPGAVEDDVTFTSGCTEANNTVLAGFARATGGGVISTAVEHPSVLRPLERLERDGAAVHRLGVDRDGLVRVAELERLLALQAGPILVSIQAANSETGVLQDMGAIAAVAARYGAILHCDAAQLFGKQPIPMGDGVGPDVVTLSGHKIHGPMGVGAIVVADGAEVTFEPLLLGGDQERGLRAGTQPLPAIAGLAVACEERAAGGEETWSELARLRDRLERRLVDGPINARINGARAPRLPNVSSVTFPGLDAMELVANLDAEGVLASQGSACSSMHPTPSHVLIAMGVGEAAAFATVRFSLSALNTAEEIDEAAATIQRVAARARRWPR